MVNADLSQLFQYSPEVAGFFAGQNQASNLQQNDEQTAELAQRIAASQGQEARANELQPYEVQGKDLANQTTAAALPGVKAKSQSEQAKADLDTATLPTTIEATNATNVANTTKAKVEQVKQAQDVLLRAGPQLESVPPLLRKAALQSIFDRAGIKAENAPELQAILNGDPHNMTTAINTLAQKLGDQALQMDSRARAQMYDANTRAAAEVKAAGIHAGATTEAARIMAGGRVAAAQARMQQMKDMLAMDPSHAAVAAHTRAALAQRQAAATSDPAEKAQLLEEANFQENLASTFEQADLNRRQQPKAGIQTAPDGSTTISTPKTVPAYGGGQKRGTGTADDPIILK